jgi:hypothetical protein
MVASLLESLQHDDLAQAVGRAVAIANREAAARGTNVAESLITITEEGETEHPLWRVHYGPRDYRNRRGGDLAVIVDSISGTVEKVIRGQ